MPEFFEALEIPHENVMGQIPGIIGFRTVAPAYSIDFLVIPVVDLLEMPFLDFPAGGGGMPNSNWAHCTHLVPFLEIRTPRKPTFRKVMSRVGAVADLGWNARIRGQMHRPPSGDRGAYGAYGALGE